MPGQAGFRFARPRTVRFRGSFVTVSSFSGTAYVNNNRSMANKGTRHIPDRSLFAAESAVEAAISRLGMVGVTRYDAVAKLHQGIQDALDILAGCGIGSLAVLRNQATVAARLYDTETREGQHEDDAGNR